MRLARVRQLWLVRTPKERTAKGVLIFYAWIEKWHPELLPPGTGDAYQHLKVDLEGLIIEGD